MADEYQIIDEPARSRLDHLATDPFWVLLATMLGGAWLGWPWFIVNSLAVGSMHRVREISAIVVGLGVAMALTAFGLWLVMQGHLGNRALPYAMTVLVVWKLAVSYWVMLWQAPSYELALHFRGVSRNGALLAFGGMFLRGMVLPALPDYWTLVLA
ncbi:MAG TPA: hypothetical protein VFQ61_21775 [Polyangiaceae bacterium]|nr:hypothetical protein [Polyangiaceae bacterium]